MKGLLNKKPFKLLLVVLGYIVFKEFLTQLVGLEATMGTFLMQAIYCRFKYFNNTQMTEQCHFSESYVELHPEVVEWTSQSMIH